MRDEHVERLAQLCCDGATWDDASYRNWVELVTLGQLICPSGEIRADDPIVSNYHALLQRIPPGAYDVVVSIIHYAEINGADMGYDVAAAMLRITPAPVVRYEPALFAEKPLTYHTYGVDSGTGCFVDEATHWADLGTYERNMEQLMLSRYQEPYGKLVALNPATGGNIAIFWSGHGDGEYPNYWGYDSEGRLACLITDFQTLDDSEWEK